MKQLTALFCCLAMVLALVSCGDEIIVTSTENTDNATAAEVSHPAVTDVLTWDKINAFPIANSDMSNEELRALCVDFFRFMQTFAWTPSEAFTYTIESSSEDVILHPDKIYGGLPYVSVASGNIYRLMDWYDPETGVVDVTEAKKTPALFGSQCSIGAYWAWGRVVNDANYTWTEGMVEKNGFQRVGPYTYREGLETLGSADYNTVAIVKENGEQTMFQSYAQMKPADGMVYFTTAGHVVMISSTPHVEYKEDGTIDGDKSYVTYIDQSSLWSDAKQTDGTPYSVQSRVDAQRSFQTIFNGAYIPFSLPELDGRATVEPSVTTLSYTGEGSITLTDLKESHVTSNYGISDVYIVIKDASAKEVFRRVARASTAAVKDIDLSKSVFETSFGKYAGADYTVEILCRISTGELVNVFEGKLLK